jgi:uncharacterized integral membrane protein (TIGR00698 family)
LAHGLTPPKIGKLVGEVIFAVGLGLVVGNVFRLPETTRPGIKFTFQTLLRLAIVLLGATFSFGAALSIGAKAIGMVVGLMALTLTTAWLLGRELGVPPKLAALIGVGTAVCGNTAISATAPVIGARDEETAFAIATNTLFGTLAVFAYPILGHALGLSDPAFGTWAGTAVNDTSQVVATGFAYSAAAGNVATVVKLTRNTMMGVVILVMGLAFASSGKTQAASLGQRIKQSVPIFVLGFLGMCLLNSIGAVAALSNMLGRDLVADAQFAAKLLILIALAGVGVGTRLSAMRTIGLRPFALGLATALVASGTSLVLIRLLGAAAPR